MITRKMLELEAAHGKHIKDLLMDLYEQYDTEKEVAKHLGVNQSTVHVWLLKLNLKKKIFLVKEDGSAA